MIKGLFHYIIVVLLLMAPAHASAQEVALAKESELLTTRAADQHNFSYFTRPSSNILLNEEVLQMNKGFEGHPELGLLSNAPCDNCYELLDRRTENTKTFAAIGSWGTQLWMMSANEPIHYKSERQSWRSLPRGLQRSGEGVFNVCSPYVPMVVDALNGIVTIGQGKHRVQLNKELTLLFVDSNKRETNLGKASWRSYTAGSDGLHIQDAWPGIDITMLVDQGRIKTNFVLKAALPRYQAGKLVIREELSLSEGLRLEKVNNSPAVSFAVVNKSKEKLYTISSAYAFEQRNMDKGLIRLPYEMKGNRVLELTIGGQYLNMLPAAYPFIIDPLFSASNSLQANTMGTKNGGVTDPCSYVNYVDVPEDVTITGLSFTFGYQINFMDYPELRINNVGMRLRLGIPGPDTCATVIYSCRNDATGGTIINQCYTMDFISVHEELKACYPPPQCASYPLPVVLDFYRSVGPSGTCDDRTVAWNYLPYTVVVEGRTLELNYPIASNLDDYNSCGDSINLSVNPEFGVPPYRYSWIPGGETTRSITVAPKSSETYSVKVWDECDHEVSAKADITVHATSATKMSKFLCSAELPYYWNGIRVNSSGAYEYKAKNKNNCDSVVTLQATVVPVRADTVRLLGCGSVPYKNKSYASSLQFRDTMRNGAGCDTLLRWVDIRVETTRVWMPNAFSPNGDGVNDEFGPELIGAEVNAYSLKIFDRWGVPVFASFSKAHKWDGTHNGQPVNMGTYYYYFRANCQNDVSLEEKGSVDLIR